MEAIDEIVSEFLVESYESLDLLDQDLLALEETPDDRDRLSSVFRTIHTIKGTSGFLAYPRLERVAHVGENLLVSLRDGELQLTNNIATGLLAMVDAVRSILGSIEAGHGEGDNSFEDLVKQLEDLKCGSTDSVTAPENAEISVEVVVDELSSESLDLTIDDSTEDFPVEITQTDDRSGDRTPEESPGLEGLSDAEDTPASNPVASSVQESEAPATTSTSVSESTVRIDVNLLDKLMNLVGELVLARNEIMQFSQNSEDAALTAASQRVNLITTELQEGVMKTRMQPIRNAWNKLPRVVRDLSHSCGKQVQVKMEGADTELDKTILEAIKDPLTHIVRNSVDHGIEPMDVRAAARKPPEGTLLLRAFHEGGQVIIEIIDDGAGINVDRVRQKAVEKELITEEQAAALSDREASQLILLPGFSTAAKVTNVSGRGVGMDVVKTNVENIGGTLDINSVPGEGTTLRIKIPLTLAIVPALVVTCDGDRFCIPQVNLLELVRVEGDRIEQEIEVLHSVPVYRLRGKLLPLVYLDEELGLRERRRDGEHHLDEAVNIVVLQAEDRQFGLVVKSINDTQEIVVKPLGVHLKNLNVYAGSTIMGDGTVSLILDVIGIAQQSKVLAEHGSRKFVENEQQDENCVNSMDSYLVVDPGDNSRAAVRLASVARLEEIDVCNVEQNGTQQVIQYRGSIMPLTTLDPYHPIDLTSPTLSVIVYSRGDRTIGVAVSRIVDIVDRADDVASIDGQSKVIAGKVTRVVDLEQVTSSVA